MGSVRFFPYMEVMCPEFNGQRIPLYIHFKGTATVCSGENKIWIFDNIVDEYDEFSHDSCESDFSWFALFSEPSVKLSQYVIMSR